MEDKMEEQELNKKLAEWVGFSLFSEQSNNSLSGRITEKWHYPNSSAICYDINLPNFTQSLDACFKWLVPKLRELRYYVVLRDISKSFHCSLVYTTVEKRSCYGEAEAPALALCLAIEKLINKERETSCAE